MQILNYNDNFLNIRIHDIVTEIILITLLFYADKMWAFEKERLQFKRDGFPDAFEPRTQGN
jgi:hypothetical protein